MGGDQGQRGVLVHVGAGMACEGHYAVFCAYRDSVKGVAVAHAIIGQLFGQFGLELLV